MTKRISKGPVIDSLSDKLKELRFQEYKLKIDSTIDEAKRAELLKQVEDERLKVKKLMGQQMLKEKIDKEGLTPEQLHIKL